MCPPPPLNLKNPQFRLIMRSIANKSQGHNQKSPLTFQLIRSIWYHLGNMQQASCLKAALTLGFFGGLRGAEYLTTPFSPGPNMSQLTYMNDSCMKYKVHKSKTKPKGFTVPYHCSKDTICAVCCMSTYLVEESTNRQLHNTAQLFSYKGKPLSKCMFNKVLKQAVACIGKDPSKYSIHSIRSGVTTTAAKNQFEDWEIRKIGGWVSNTYLTYIRHNPRNSKRFSRLTQCS